MKTKSNFTSPQMRVSVQFRSPDSNRLDDDTAHTRYKKKTETTHKQRVTFLNWLERNHITYENVTEAGAFSTIFLSVDAEAIPKLKSAPDVLDVDIDEAFNIDPLKK